jgi:predicted aspartyl protease
MNYLKKYQKDILKKPLLDIGININGKCKVFEAIVDTGFDGFISINLELALILGFKPIGKMRVINIDNQPVFDTIFQVQIELPDLEIAKAKYNCKITGKKDQLEELVIGQNFLNLICLNNNCKLCFDYPDNCIYFETSN